MPVIMHVQSNNVFMTTNSFLEFPKYLCRSLYDNVRDICLTGHLPSSKEHFRIPAECEISMNGCSACCDACFVQLKKYFVILQYTEFVVFFDFFFLQILRRCLFVIMSH